MLPESEKGSHPIEEEIVRHYFTAFKAVTKKRSFAQHYIAK